MREIGKPETIEASRSQGWLAKVAVLLVHSNKYGWCTRVGGWTGPKDGDFASKEEAVAYVEKWIAESPNTRCAVVSE